jgi:hypothetical protein
MFGHFAHQTDHVFLQAAAAFFGARPQVTASNLDDLSAITLAFP